MRLLLVEDDPALGGAIRDYLTREAYVVDWATTLAAARASLSAEHGSVILDLGLPDGDGLALLPAVRQHDEPAAVLILTARDRLSDRVRGLDAGADDYLVKPFDLPELCRPPARRRAPPRGPERAADRAGRAVDRSRRARGAARRRAAAADRPRIRAGDGVRAASAARAHAAPARGSDLRARRGRRQQRRRGLRVAAAAQARPRRDHGRSAASATSGAGRGWARAEADP